MTALERLKRKITSRLTGEPDIIYFDKTIDSKVAKLTYKNREIIVEERSSGYVIFMRKGKEYTYNQDFFAKRSKDDAIAKAKEIIKNDEVWE